MTHDFNLVVEMSNRKVESLLNVLQFTTKILLPKYPQSLFPLLSTLYIAKQDSVKRKIKLKLSFVPEDVFESLIPFNIKSSVNGIMNTCILVSFNTLETLNLSSCSWIEIKQCSEKLHFNVKQSSYMVQVIARSDIEDSIGVVTNILYYNLKEMLFLHSDEVRASRLEDITSFTPSVANLIKVSLLQSSLDIKSSLLDTILSNYFEQPHYLCVGSVFCIDITKYAPAMQYQDTKLKKLYFKVDNIEGSCNNQQSRFGYYVQKEHTSLIFSGIQHEFIPPSDVVFVREIEDVTGSNYKSKLLSTCPNGLDSYREELLSSIKPFVFSEKELQIKPLFLVCGPRGVGKGEVIKNVAEKLGMNMWVVDSLELRGETSGYTEAKLKFVFTKVTQMAPTILLLKNVELLCKERDGSEDNRAIASFIDEAEKTFQHKRNLPVILIATSNSLNETKSVIAPSLARIFIHEIHINTPNEEQRHAMLQWLTRKGGVRVKADLTRVAALTSGFVFSDLSALIFHAIRNRLKTMKKSPCNPDLELSQHDFDVALDVMHAAYSDAIDAPKIPKVSWEDVGGLQDLKDEIIRTITLPLQHPELLAAGLRRSGILLYGPPGTGKTLLAKAVATECNLNFLSVKGPELLNMYVGQSEENVREVFDRARAASPCIIFFDELDSLAPNRGRSGDSGGVMDRIVSQLLAEMDGLQKSSHLFVIGATNRPDLIDPALLRPGRFDKLLYVGISDNKESQLSILVALTRKFHLKSDLRLEDIVALLPDKLTGADLYSLCSQAWLNAVRTRIHKKSLGEECLPSLVEVGLEDFTQVIAHLVPSVSQEDLEYFQQIRDKM